MDSVAVGLELSPSSNLQNMVCFFSVNSSYFRFQAPGYWLLAPGRAGDNQQ